MQITAPFDLSTFADGTFPVVGKVSGAGFEVTLASSTSTSPWALYVLGLLSAVAVLLAVAVMIGAHYGRREGDQDHDAIPGLPYDDATKDLVQLGAAQ